MAEELFVVRTSREGTVRPTPTIEGIVSRMGITAFQTRHLGRVAVVVESVDGRITKQKVNFDPDNDANFNTAHQQNADVLLGECIAAVNGNGGSNGIKVIMTTKI